MVSQIYIYIYDLEFNWISTLRFFYLIIYLPQKLKMNKWTRDGKLDSN